MSSVNIFKCDDSCEGFCEREYLFEICYRVLNKKKKLMEEGIDINLEVINNLITKTQKQITKETTEKYGRWISNLK